MSISYNSSQWIAESSGTSTDDTLTVPTLNLGLAVVGIEGDLFSGNDDLVSVTLGGQTMTLIDKVVGSADRYGYLLYLVNPPSGSQHLIITFGSSHVIGRVISYYGGVKKTGQPDAFNHNVANTTTSLSTSVTTVADNCWLVAYGKSNSGDPGAGAGTTQRQSQSGFGIFDSNGVIHPAGTGTLVITAGGSTTIGCVMASFSPALNTGNMFLIF